MLSKPCVLLLVGKGGVDSHYNTAVTAAAGNGNSNAGQGANGGYGQLGMMFGGFMPNQQQVLVNGGNHGSSNAQSAVSSGNHANLISNGAQ